MTKTMNQKVRDGYNIAAVNYSSNYRDLFKSEKYLDLLIKKLHKNSGILDIGCGSGIPVDSYLVENGFKVTGIDISEKQIELAQKNVPNANFEVKDMSTLDDHEYSVDAVVSFYALFHISKEQHLDVLKKIHSFLNHNGYLLITMGAKEWEGKEDDFCGTEMYWSHYGIDKNKKLVSQARFEIIFDEIDTSGDEEHLVVLAKKL